MYYKFSEQAGKDLEDILIEGILNWGELQALKYQDSFKRIFELLAYMPTIGWKSERHFENEHRFPHGKHVIYYRTESDHIVIQNIIYGPLIKDPWGDL